MGWEFKGAPAGLTPAGSHLVLSRSVFVSPVTCVWLLFWGHTCRGVCPRAMPAWVGSGVAQKGSQKAETSLTLGIHNLPGLQ